jgi:predicted permease
MSRIARPLCRVQAQTAVLVRTPIPAVDAPQPVLSSAPTWTALPMAVVKHTLRAFRRNPAVLLLAVATLALGIGSTTAVFKVVDATLIRPLPYPGSDRIFEVWTLQSPDGLRLQGVTAPLFWSLRQQRQLFDLVEGWQFGIATLTGDGEPALVSSPRITHGLLPALGIAPRLGRLFDARDATPGARVALISERLWGARFGGSPDVLNRRILVDGEPYAIVGVLPVGFAFPEQEAAVWRPLQFAASAPNERAQMLVRLRPGVARASVDHQLEALSASLAQSGVLDRNRRLVLEEPIQSRYARGLSTALLAMLGAIALVLLVACVNVSNLLLGRATIQQAEFALRRALGASRGAIAAQVLFESACLAALGGAGGILVAHVLLATTLELVPRNMVFLAAAAAIDWRAVACAVAVAAATCLVVAAVTAWRVADLDLIETLKARSATAGERGSERWQSALVVGQLALVLVLLTGAGLLLRSFVRLTRVDPGFDPANLTVFEIQLPEGRYDTPGSAARLFEELQRQAIAMPGVAAATFANGAPPRGGGISFVSPEAEGRGSITAGPIGLPSASVAPTYFATLGVPVVEGRSFVAEDGKDAIVVNDRFARALWGSESAVGKRVRLDPSWPWQTVVGVVADVKQLGPDEPFGHGMEVYFPLSPDAAGAAYVVFLVRGHLDPLSAIAGIKQRLWTLDPRLPVYSAMTMEQVLGASIARPRFLLRVAALFAAVAAILAAIGIYGTAAYWAARRRRELAIRMAVGATGGDVVRLIVARSARLALWGCGLGAGVSIAAAGLLRSLLFQTEPRDPFVLVGMSAVLAAVVLVACYLPALRASRSDPAGVLRAE